MRKVFMGHPAIAVIIFIFVGSSATARSQWQSWKSWAPDIGISPFADIYYAVSTSDSLGAYKIERTGVDFVGGIQANIPPVYLRYGFSNLRALFPPDPNDTTGFSLFFANLRIGLRIPYEGAICDLSVLLVTNVFSIGDAKFLGVMAEGAYLKNIAGIDIFGTVRGGFENTTVPDGAERSDKTIGVSLGAEWNKGFITPYIGATIASPITGAKMELRWLVFVGIQLSLPYTYVARLPSIAIAYPRVYRKIGS